MKRLGLIALAIVALLTSCTEEEDFPIIRNMTSFGSVNGDVITDDSGLTYKVAEITEGVNLKDGDRMYYQFDVTGKISEKEYEIRLKYLFEPLVKKALALPEIDQEILGDDPVMVDNGWISKGYANLAIEFSYLENSSTKHFINLVEDNPFETDTLRLRLCHNGFGEGHITEGNPQNLDSGYTFVCFSLTHLIPTGMASIPVKITGSWYTYNEEGNITEELVPMVVTGIVKR